MVFWIMQTNKRGVIAALFLLLLVSNLKVYHIVKYYFDKCQKKDWNHFHNRGNKLISQYVCNTIEQIP
jgi:hypothetical protein